MRRPPEPMLRGNPDVDPRQIANYEQSRARQREQGQDAAANAYAAFSIRPPAWDPRSIRRYSSTPGSARRKRENRFADRVTAFAGSMRFVYIHVIWFGCWIGFGVEDYPYGLLTMIVSLEAIFLSTFVLISQNRADAKRQVLADQQWTTVQKEEEQNVELLDVSRQILTLTQEVHSVTRSVADLGDRGRSSDAD